MQFLQISSSTTLQDVSSMVGSKNVDNLLQLNSLQRRPDVGAQYAAMVSAASALNDVTASQKLSIINTMTKDSDVFEAAAMLSEDGWKALKAYGSFPDYLRVPETVSLPISAYTLGDGQSVSSDIYSKVTESIKVTGRVDPAIFNQYSSNSYGALGTVSNSSAFQSFHLPWGKVSLYSSITGTALDFPVYPEDLDDDTNAVYEQMPDLIYQYEPWQTYKSSGPRSITVSFKMHRDMWTGDHRDGKCKELVRFCQAQCYPRYRGAAVIPPISTLYIDGAVYIRGVMTSVKPHWEGPLGLDGWYLVCKLDLTITEVSQVALNFDTVRNGGLVGWDT